ncbi:MAG: sulfur oxidation c-type cytochrome SoxX [Gammaproteobacteria bacterium]|nr:sulfur oxidation c-type cytochrome SoxX [Gammaproteobacteria bacterium]
MMGKYWTAICQRALLALVLAPAPAAAMRGADGQNLPPSAIAEGRRIALSPRLGNCTACHAIAGTSADGNLGPALRDIRRLFPNKAALFAEIYDPTIMAPRTAMPPFGKYRILTSGQIQKLVDFLWTL